MPRLIVEVMKSKTEADARSEYYKQLGCQIEGVSSYNVVTWLNNTGTPASDTAADALDDEVWVVRAVK